MRLDHDIFITTDKCLFKSWRRIIHKHKQIIKQRFKIPKIVYAPRNPNEVAKKMLISFLMFLTTKASIYFIGIIKTLVSLSAFCSTNSDFHNR